MKNVDSLFEPNRIDRPVCVTDEILYDLENTSATEAMYRLCVDVFVASLSPHQSGANVIFDLLRKTTKSLEGYLPAI